jgi:GNAT superfamily N-acetyltransferase
MDVDENGLVVRALRASDAPRLTRIDQAITGRNRGAWYDGKLKRALEDSDVNVSLGAERDGLLLGAVLGSLHYGEFGQPEPIAILDTILVDPGYARRGVGSALLAQLTRNLSALGIERLRTEVAWDEHELNRFLGREGFVPAARIVLEMHLAPESAERIPGGDMIGIMGDGLGVGDRRGAGDKEEAR